MEDQKKPVKGNGYGKRPLWHWILIYIVVGGLIYLLIYLFLFSNGDDNGSSVY
jgi:hypothetical protein